MQTKHKTELLSLFLNYFFHFYQKPKLTTNFHDFPKKGTFSNFLKIFIRTPYKIFS